MNRIKYLRAERRWGQAKLAESADIRVATVSELENGKGNPRLSTLVAVARALSVSVSDLFDSNDDPEARALTSAIHGLAPATRTAIETIIRNSRQTVAAKSGVTAHAMEMSGFANRLTALLDKLRMSRADLARATDIPYHRLNRWFVRPDSKPNGPDLLAVSQALGVSEHYLINGGELRPYDVCESLVRRVRELDEEDTRQVAQFLDFLASRGSPTGGR
ncbi:helix-turn-helix transcriptional regulator [Pikeienuella sp. HZG-20]|uniref:helix-turn-helix transcriptional regulator n=1 Tax=Paludibacillus litoralis TaxID=3133267 RepID=UPI0030EDE7DB